MYGRIYLFNYFSRPMRRKYCNLATKILGRMSIDLVYKEKFNVFHTPCIHRGWRKLLYRISTALSKADYAMKLSAGHSGLCMPRTGK